MKKTLLSLLILLSAFGGYSQVTNIDSFYLPGTTWSWINQTHPGLTGTPCKAIFYSHKIERDSVINGMNYHLMSARDIGSNGCGTGSFYHVNIDIPVFGGIRVDGRKVYFLLFDTLTTVNAQQPYVGESWQEFINDYYTPGVEEILYDFDLNIGSTLSWKPNFTVSTIDSVALTNGDSLATYTFTGLTTSDYDKWIEGIGSTSNFFLTQWRYPLTKLVCYSGAPGSYLHQSIYCSYLETDVKEQKISDENLVFYPNPLNNDVLQVKADKRVQSLLIRDNSGRVIEHHEIKANQKSIQTSLPVGLYIIKVGYADGNSAIQKLIKL